MKKHYTVGFIFNKSLEKVLLIHKLRPEWQNGKINGIGGKFEDGEESLDCIVREIKEETGIRTNKQYWVYAGSNTAPDWKVDFYAYHFNGEESEAQSMTDETVEWFNLSQLPANLIPNLHWLIPLAKNKLVSPEYNEFVITYSQ